MRILKNTYYLLRHGRSKANEKGIILSNPEEGILPEWGLTEEGKKQVKKTVSASDLPDNTIIYSSDFARAWETATLLAEIKKLRLIKTELLRERFFGDLDKQDDSLYNTVWAGDHNKDNHENGVESPEEVCKRTSSLIMELEKNSEGETYVLVSHGDALQILQTWFKKEPSSRHRKLKHLETAELRPLFQ